MFSSCTSCQSIILQPLRFILFPLIDVLTRVARVSDCHSMISIHHTPQSFHTVCISQNKRHENPLFSYCTLNSKPVFCCIPSPDPLVGNYSSLWFAKGKWLKCKFCFYVIHFLLLKKKEEPTPVYTLCHRRTKGSYSVSLCKPDSRWTKYKHQGLAHR